MEKSIACPVCDETIRERVSWSPLLRELRLHCLFAHQEELQARLDNPKDRVIAELAELEIVVSRKDKE